MSVRGRKVLRDLWLQRGRAALVVMAMALGMFGVVWISSSSAVLSRELRAQYLASDPASATIVGEGLTPALAAQVRALPGVAAAETATTVTARVRIGPSDYVPLKLFARDEFTANSIAKLTPQTGAWPPPENEVVIEREALRVAETTLGATIDVDIPGGPRRQLRVAGSVHDLGQAPAWQDGLVYGYVTPKTLATLGFAAEPTELRIVVDGDRLNPDHINTVALTVADNLRTHGVRVSRVLTPVPGEHPHQSQMDSLLWVQQAFGVLALVLSGLLVAALISALLAGQVRQIGALKAVGARTGQVSWIYASMTFVLAALAIAIGWPLGWFAARGYITMVSAILNFDVNDTDLSPWLIVAQILIGLAVPLLAATIPVLRATRITPAAAMSGHGISAPVPVRQSSKRTRIATWLSGLSLPRLPLMAVRNAFRRRGRVAITMIALALGGSTFIAALNLGTSLDSTMDGQAMALRYDIAIGLDRPYPSNRVADVARGVRGVAVVETWLRTPVTVGTTATSTTVPTLYGVPVDSRMLDLPVLSGRWLRPDDADAIVVSHTFAEDHPAARVGADVVLDTGGAPRTWHVVGVVRQVAAPPAAWASYGDLAATLKAEGTTNAVRILTTSNDSDALTSTRRLLDDALTAEKIGIVAHQNTVEAQQVLRDHILIIIVFLGLMTLLSVGIGGLGLATTMAVNVIERTREVGMLRAVGATTRAVLTLIVTEGGLIGALSWLVALALSVPASLVFGRVLGEIFIASPLDYVVNAWGPLAWLGIVVVLSGLASVAPARRAAALSVRDTLSYQ